MSKHVVLVHDADEDAWASLPEDEKQAVYDGDAAFARLLMEHGGRITGGAELEHSREARVVRRGGTVTDGPFAETAEVLNGFFLVDGVDRETLVDLAETLAQVHDVVEVRPLTDD